MYIASIKNKFKSSLQNLRHKTGIALYFLILVFCLNSCEEDHIDEVLSSKPDAEKLLEIVNNYRQNGCYCGTQYFPPTDPVVWNELLEAAAQRHSDDMNENDFISHTGSDGSTMGDRVSDTGYNWSVVGENISFGAKTEEEAIERWMNSDGHCGNIMNPYHKNMGVARSGDYWTQVLAR